MRPNEDMSQETESKKKGRIGKDEILKAADILTKYASHKKPLDERIRENERWFRLRHWDALKKEGDTLSSSAWMFNALANKHADVMDNYPQPNVLPREKSDMPTADALSEIIPVLLEYNKFPKVYDATAWYKIKNGTGVNKIIWNATLNNGLGDVQVVKSDILNLFWEPGITDIQESENFFEVEYRDIEQMKKMYPKVKFQSDAGDAIVVEYDHESSQNETTKVKVVDWYYKVKDGSKTILHYCKFANEQVLYASENDPEYAERGYYDHGMYPYVFDVLFPEADMPVGFGYIDIMKAPQTFIDKLDRHLMQSALVASKKRVIVRADSGIKPEDFADIEKDVVVSDASLGDDAYREITYQPLPPIYAELRQAKIDELKETSGNRDFSQGSTTNGVTAASAIAALQEAGSKLSRDMISASYRAFSDICYMIIELIRQFYDYKRVFRISRENGYEFMEFDNSGLQPVPQGNEFGVDLGVRLPIFDIKVSPERESAYTRLSQNELALQFYQAGFFNPQMADQALATVEMMDFDGKDDVIEKISQNGMMYQQMMAMQQQLAQLSAIVDAQNGTTLSQGMGMPGPAPIPGGQLQQRKPTMAERAGAVASGQATPKTTQ